MPRWVDAKVKTGVVEEDPLLDWGLERDGSVGPSPSPAAGSGGGKGSSRELRELQRVRREIRRMSEGLVELRGEVGRLSQELVETREAIPIPPDLDLEGGLSLGWLEEDPRPLRRQSVQMEGPLRRVVLETSISTSPVSRFSGGERTFWDHLMGGE